MSLEKDGKNVFYNENDSSKLSDTAHKFTAGLLKYTPDMACFTNPTVNSYKRFIPDMRHLAIFLGRKATEVCL